MTQAQGPRAAPTLGVAVLGGLLSSSCCVLQLLLNALSFGCAGFSLLSPFRPWFLAVTAGSLGLAHWRNRNARQTLLALTVSASLALTPELVRFYVEGKPPLPPPLLRLWPHPRPGDRGSTPAAPAGAGISCPERETSKHTPLDPAWAAVELQAKGIRCAGCAARVRHAVLARVPGARECSVEFETGRVAVAGRGVTAAAVAVAVEELGYMTHSVLAGGSAAEL